jgi:hypothetical protein
MKLLRYFFQSKSEECPKLNTEVAIPREVPKNRRRSRRFLLIGIRSTSDQLQIVAIPTSQLD